MRRAKGLMRNTGSQFFVVTGSVSLRILVVPNFAELKTDRSYHQRSFVSGEIIKIFNERDAVHFNIFILFVKSGFTSS